MGWQRKSRSHRTASVMVVLTRLNANHCYRGGDHTKKKKAQPPIFHCRHQLFAIPVTHNNTSETITLFPVTQETLLWGYIANASPLTLSKVSLFRPPALRAQEGGGNNHFSDRQRPSTERATTKKLLFAAPPNPNEYFPH